MHPHSREIIVRLQTDGSNMLIASLMCDHRSCLKQPHLVSCPGAQRSTQRMTLWMHASQETG